ncbi:MAG: hypothetical protein ACXVEF_32275 [Polyangiales bacterium]
MLFSVNKSFLIVPAFCGLVAVIGVACGGSDSSSATCDPASDPSCTATGDETGAGDSTAVDDGSVPTTDVGTGGKYPPGSEILPDGAIKLPDGAIVGPDGSVVGCVPGGTQCTNCIDDDKDGLIDWLDPECTGPLDNDEGSYATGIPGDNIDPCKQDCWFDGNSGSGNDGCLFDLRCSKGTANKDCPFDPAIVGTKECAPPSDKCKKYCQPLVPKGCDCDGCCQVYDATGAVHTVKLTSTCTTEALGDPTKCPTCTQIADCGNPCGHCDFCLGKLTLPADCYPDAGPPPSDGGTVTDTGTPPPPGTCPSGLTPCSPSSPCPSGEYCLTGCCIIPPK